MEETKRNLGKNLDTIDPNTGFTYLLSGFMVALGALVLVTSGFSVGPLIFAVCAIGSGAFFLMQSKKYKVRIYEEGLDVEGGLLTPSGRYKYSEMADISGEKTTYRVLGMIPVFSYFNVTIYKKGAPEGTPLTNLSSFNFANLENKYLLIEEKIRD